MSRVVVHLYDAVADMQFLALSDDDADANGVLDLNGPGWADRAARVVVSPGTDYVPGDHVRLLDEVRTAGTDVVSVDPLVVGDVDLNGLHFADRAAALHFQLNPGRQFRLRLALHDAVGQVAPNLVLYDWQVPGSLDLNTLHFAGKTARVQVTPGAAFHPADHARLFAGVQTTQVDAITVDPLVAQDVDLNGLDFADRAQAVGFQLNPLPQYRLRVELFDRVGRPIPHQAYYDWQAGGPLDLNPLHFADKAARVRVSQGAGYRPGDHVRLLDQVRQFDTDMVAVDPLVLADLDLNGLDFADRAAALDFQLNPLPTFRLRVELHDRLAQVAPTMVLYDWQAEGLADLNRLHLADKVARVVLGKGGGYHPGDHVRLLDEVQSLDTDMVSCDPLVTTDANLNLLGFADRAAALEFQLNPGADFAARADLYDRPDSVLPTIVLYDWQQGGTLTDLNRLHFADKAAAIRVAGPHTMIILPVAPLHLVPTP